MVGLTCLLMVAVCSLLRPASLGRLVAASVGFVFAALDLALCFYVPHLVPLAWLAFLFLAFWTVANRREILVAERARTRLGLMAISLAVAGLVGLSVYRDARVAFAGIAHTNYPGRRVIQSGTWNPLILPSQLMPWSETENQFPTAGQNICEGTGFLWLAPITLSVPEAGEGAEFERAVTIFFADGSVRSTPPLACKSIGSVGAARGHRLRRFCG